MATKRATTLNENQFQHLQKECYVLVTTVDPALHTPYVNAISWVYAPDVETIIFAIDSRSKAVQNINENENVSITLIEDETTSVVNGTAEVMEEQMDAVPIKLSMIKVHVSEVRDAMFYGAKISQPPEYEKTYDPQAAARLDRQVMTALKRRPS
ncbi:pyridoxamine 5'-phosphate oxidase family protein [Pseudalkalibacillus sp. SCS-8]|uniref:pyridoxamine 5'-phosphate oxidase family protein n=1 Tax=Pseudalkalibacillus nanhaiensis TaxID=3115291 RepID=UPI0032DAA454